MEIPDSYVVMDTETHHYDDPFVLQAGFCLVENGEVSAVENINIIPPDDVVITEKATSIHGLTKESLEKDGSDRMEILPEIRAMLEGFGESWLMGQNFTFDTDAFNCTFKKVGLEPIDFSAFHVIDVGVTYKAYRLMTEWGWGDRARFRGSNGSDMHKFFRFIRSQRIRGLRWSIDYCMEHFEVDAPKRGDHNAGEDCRLTHLIYQKMLDKGIVQEVLFHA